MIGEMMEKNKFMEEFSAALSAAGGKAVLRAEGESLDDIARREFPELFPSGGDACFSGTDSCCRTVSVSGDAQYPGDAAAPRIASNLQGCGNFNPDDVEDPRSLDGTALAIVRGEFGVAENGAVWIEQNVRHRGLYFISEALMIVIPAGTLARDMHEAYARLEATASTRGYGIFISGPSKTADIEQALVFGAHGARRVVVVLE